MDDAVGAVMLDINLESQQARQDSNLQPPVLEPTPSNAGVGTNPGTDDPTRKIVSLALAWSWRPGTHWYNYLVLLVTALFLAIDVRLLLTYLGWTPTLPDWLHVG